MKLSFNQLGSHLERGLAGLYLIAADEPLLVAEATDLVRDAARARGFTERKLYVVERGFRWESLVGDGENLSLFAEKRIVEIRMASPRPGDAGAKAIRALAETGDPDRVCIVSIQSRLDRTAQRSVWARSVEQHGVILDIRPVTRETLPRFVVERGRRKGLTVEAEAAELLADRVEGNLLAADQELTKLALICDDDRVDSAAVLEAVAMSARYDVFRLSDAVLAGDLGRALTVLAGLRSEGVAPPLVLWALTREILLLSRLKHASAKGQNVEQLMGRLRVWQSRQPLVRRALARYGDSGLSRLVGEAARVDRIVKGVERAPAWESITALVLDLLAPPKRRRTA